MPFWDDVEAKAAEVLENESKFQHYMGALILAPIGEGSQINGVRVRSGTRFESKDEKGNETSLHGRSRRSDVSSGGEARVYSGRGVVSRL